MTRAAEIRAVVLYSPAPREVHEWPVVLAPGSTVLQALQACGLQAAFPDLDLHSAIAGVWGRKARLEQVVREGDRVEIYRPLKVDPKLARRERFRKQGVRAAGLFARKENGTRRDY
jgi:putative ubiquitin-RnfH superfamily antitoxin RatB of RatAB toxin-antitoxin module